MTALQLLDYAARMKLDTIQLDLNTYESLEPSYVQKVRDHAARLNIPIDGSLGCICQSSSSWRPENRDPVQYLRTGLRVSKGVVATCMQVFAGGNRERVGLQNHIDNTLKVLRAVRSEAQNIGVKIAVENHGDFQAWGLRELIETAGKDYVAACLDSGNAVIAIGVRPVRATGEDWTPIPGQNSHRLERWAGGIRRGVAGAATRRPRAQF